MKAHQSVHPWPGAYVPESADRHSAHHGQGRGPRCLCLSHGSSPFDLPRPQRLAKKKVTTLLQCLADIMCCCICSTQDLEILHAEACQEVAAKDLDVVLMREAPPAGLVRLISLYTPTLITSLHRAKRSVRTQSTGCIVKVYDAQNPEI